LTAAAERFKMAVDQGDARAKVPLAQAARILGSAKV
jgi:hypothetical protein